MHRLFVLLLIGLQDDDNITSQTDDLHCFTSQQQQVLTRLLLFIIYCWSLYNNLHNHHIKLIRHYNAVVTFHKFSPYMLTERQGLLGLTERQGPQLACSLGGGGVYSYICVLPDYKFFS